MIRFWMVDGGELLEDGGDGGELFVASFKVNSVQSLGSTSSNLDGDGNGGGSQELGLTS